MFLLPVSFSDMKQISIQAPTAWKSGKSFRELQNIAISNFFDNRFLLEVMYRMLMRFRKWVKAFSNVYKNRALIIEFKHKAKPSTTLKQPPQNTHYVFSPST
jgi:hypothetical protein